MMKAKEIGVELDPRAPELKEFLQQLKDLEFKGYEYEAADASFKLLLARFLKGKQADFEFIGYRCMVSHQAALERVVSEATVQVKVNGETHHTVCEANGPVDALAHALSKRSHRPFLSFGPGADRLQSAHSGRQHGTDAIIRVQVDRDMKSGDAWGTVGASDNIIEATWEALVDAVE